MNRLVLNVFFYSFLLIVGTVQAKEKIKTGPTSITSPAKKSSKAKIPTADCDLKKNPFVEKKEEPTRTVSSDSSAMKKPSLPLNPLNPLNQDAGCQLPKKSF
jgi:hypothetical protein